MRILYCNKYNYSFSGTEVYLFDLMRLMRDQGHEVALFSVADARGEASEYEKHYVRAVDFKDKSHTIWNKLRLGIHAVYSRQARRKIAQMIGDFRPELAHVRNIYHQLTPSILWELKRRGIPVLYHLNDFKLLCPSYNLVAHGDACERCRGGRFWRVVAEGCYAGGRMASAALAIEAYAHRWLQTYQKCVDRFLVPSQFVKQKLTENGWDPRKIDVLSHFQRISGAAPPRPAHDAPILYFGRLSREKGVADLLRAMQLLPSLRLNIAGDGPLRGELERMAELLGLANVTFLGHVAGQQLDRTVADARFTVLPSRAYETLGKTILESYAQGRAVIASDLGSRREFVHEGKTGLLYPVGDVEALAERIAFLADRPQLTAEMGTAGRQWVQEHHSPEDHYRAMTQLYERLAGNARKTSRYRRTSARRAEGPVPSRLRVAFIGARGVIGKYSGIEGYYEEVGRRLAQSGHEVTIYCRSYFTPDRREHNGMRLVRLPTVRSKHLETAVHTFLSSVHAMFRRCEIVHYHALGPSLFSFLPKVAGKKVVVTVQGLDWQRKKWGRLAASVLRLGERAAVAIPHRTMVVSRTLRTYFDQKYGADTVYVPNGAPLREKGGNTLLREWSLEAGKYVLFLGRFSPEKNCDLLIEAFERIHTEAMLVLAGGSNSSDTYTQGLLRHASSRIRFLHYVSGNAFDELLTNAMLLVLPSDMEGLSLALLEGMGAGLCVLASDIPENVELVDGAGFTFKRGDVADLSEKMALLIGDAEARELAGRRARLRIRDHYQWDPIAAEIEKLYGEVLGETNVRTLVSLDETKGTSSKPSESVSPTRRAGLRRGAS